MSLFSNLSSLFAVADQKQGKRSARPTGPVKPGNKPKFQQNKKKQHPKPQRPTPQKAAPVTQQQPPQQNVLQTDVVREAQAKAREIIVEAKSEALTIRSKAETESRDVAKQVEEQQRSLEHKLDRIDSRLEQLDVKEKTLNEQQQRLIDKEKELTEKKLQAIAELEKVSSLTTEEAKRELFSQLEKSMKRDLAQFVRQKQEEAQSEAEEKVQEILVDAMKHGATDYVSEYTVSVVELPNEEAKGKIIGKSGRNINSFERETGVDVDLDMSPTEVRLSCFDPVRREIARISLERLIKDGRIQPTRIEETVSKVRSEMDKIVLEAGKKLCHDVGVYNLPIDLMKLLGKFKYRFSYGQNMIAHTLEETRIGMKLASELKLDVNVVKLGCLLHDIGKVSEEAEGSHVELGVKIAKRFNIPQTVIDCIAQHHEDEPFSGPEQMVVYIADAISGARPGARYENYDEYVARLQKLEDIATAYDSVKTAFAIQAGREVRVLLKPQDSQDDDVVILSRKIRDEIKEKVTYPGTVTVTVIRETRNREVAS
ncbi:ribonuclease Y [Candidatus Woesebacteria bacterium]|nr:ribonuclease Y [Candidatus Woesebacteria bacterium]